MQKMIIAIDGLAATGKSTQAKRLATYLKYRYIDSGAMYRAVTWFALQNNCCASPKQCDVNALIAHLPALQITFKTIEKGSSTLFLNGENREKEIRGMEVSQLVSTVAAIPEVRTFLVDQQRSMAQMQGIVMDGRDIGTVVFPNADLKFFFTARPEVRAQRRYDELRTAGQNPAYNTVLENVTERDRLDSTRAIAPLVKAPDAIEIDVSDLDLEATFQRLLTHLPKNH